MCVGAIVTLTSGAGKEATMGHIVAGGDFLLVPAKVKWDNAGCGSTGRGPAPEQLIASA
jgi:hypothetical protein